MTALLNRLIIEGSGPQLALLLQTPDQIYTHISEADGRHDQRLLTDLTDVLAHANVAADQLSEIAVGIGPGSFTGIRVALASAQGLAMALGLPLKGLDSMALSIAAEPAGIYHVVMDARLGEAYEGIYRVSEQALEVLVAPRLISVDQVAQQAPSHVRVGEGWALIDQEGQPISLQPNQRWLALLDAASSVAPEQLEPAYLRDTVNWKKVSEQPSPLSK